MKALTCLALLGLSLAFLAPAKAETAAVAMERSHLSGQSGPGTTLLEANNVRFKPG